MRYTSTVSAPLRQFHPVVWQKTFTDGPTSTRWSKLLSWGATGVLRVPAVFREYILRVLGSISGCCTADILYSKYSGVRYCGYAGTRSTLTAHTPSTRSIQAFSTVHTPSTRSTNCTRYSEYTRSTKYTGSIYAVLYRTVNLRSPPHLTPDLSGSGRVDMLTRPVAAARAAAVATGASG